LPVFTIEGLDKAQKGTHMKNKTLRIVTLIAALALVACGKKSADNSSASAASVSVDPVEASVETGANLI
jgi:hypothetical protein